jgi:hypothetical protein
VYNDTFERVPFPILLQVVWHYGCHRDSRQNPHHHYRELGTIELQVKNEKNPDSIPVTYRRFVVVVDCALV